MSDRFHFSPRPNKANQIHWKEWSEEAFKEAKEHDKLILLSIDAVWCHWCHVMDETSFSYKPNINLINDEFVSIRVDSDKRPDLNKRFNMGGWPTTVILTPDGDILNGGTYMPDKTLYSFLTNTSRYYKINRKKGKNIVIDEQDYDENLVSEKSYDVDEEILKNIDSAAYLNFDTHFGGFEIEPKFPHTETLDYLIHRYFNKQSDMMFKVITKTLTSMASGGIYDHEDGGFFRYSTTRDWGIPHYEKMLEDNARLLDVYLKMYQLTGEGKYLSTCSGTMEFMHSNLLDAKNGVFYGSQDADEQYYSLKKEQRKERNEPYIDKTIYTDWNAIAASSYVRTYYVLDNQECLNIALRGMSFLMNNCYDGKKGMYHYYTKSPNISGILDDQIYTINALLDIYEVTSENRYIYDATSLADLTLKNFYDKKEGGFFDDIIEYNFAPSVQKKEKSLKSNAIASQVFYRLFDFSGLEKYKEAAHESIYLFSKEYEQHSFFASVYGKAVLRYLAQPLKISVVGDMGENKTIAMVSEALKAFMPFRLLEILDIEKDKDKIELSGYNSKNSPAGYICRGENCLNPVFSPEDIVHTLENNSFQ